MRVRYSTDPRVSRPSTSTEPASGAISPIRIFSEVVLPAPFEPSRPVTPSPISKLAPSSARTEPKLFVTPETRTSCIAVSVCEPGHWFALEQRRRVPLDPFCDSHEILQEEPMRAFQAKQKRHGTKLAFVVSVSVLSLGLTLTTGAGAAERTQLQRTLDQVVATGVPGAILVVRNGDETIRLTSGLADLKGKTQIQIGDRFRVGSLTKTFVSAVLLQLEEEGKLDLDDSVDRWLPGVVPNGKH